MVMAVSLVMWVVGIEVRLVYLQILAARRSGRRAPRKQQISRIPVPASAATSSTARGRVLATSVDADTIIRPSEGRRSARRRVVKLCRRARRLPSDKERQTLDRRLRRGSVHLRAPADIGPIRNRRVEALDLDGVAFVKESTPFLSEERARRAPARVRRCRQHWPGRSRGRVDSRIPWQGRQGARADGRAAACVQPHRSPAHGGLDNRADDRRVPAARRRTGAARRRRRPAAPPEGASSS